MTGGGLRTQHGQVQILQSSGEVGTTTDIVSDGPSGAPRERSAAAAYMCMGKDTVTDSTTDGDNTSRGGSRVCDAQRGGIQDAAANGSTSVLDLPGNMEFGG